jgi:acyl-CoA thioesterase-1
MKHAAWLLLILALFLGGCRQHPQPAASSSAATSSVRKVPAAQSAAKKAAAKKSAPAASAAAEHTIIAQLQHTDHASLVYAPLGDSLSVGLFADSRQFRFTSLFATALGRAVGKPVTEKGVAVVGKTAANLGVPSIAAIVSQQPDLVTIEFGTNDAVGGASTAVLAAFRQDLTTIVTSLQKQTRAALILMTTWSPANGQYIASDQAFDAQIKAVGWQYHVPVADLRTIWQGNASVTGPAGQALPDFSQWGRRDTFHPNQRGHQAIADLLMTIARQAQ